MPSIPAKAALSKTSYGKSRIRLVQVSRRGDRHDLRDLTVAIGFEGDYDTSYTDGDNRDVLPTDTMKNTVYALAARDGASAQPRRREIDEVGELAHVWRASCSRYTTRPRA